MVGRLNSYGDLTQTEFNSNIATLMRIDNLMKDMQFLNRGVIPPSLQSTNKEINVLILDTLRQLYVEAHGKMVDDEIDTCNSYTKRIKDKLFLYGNSLSSPFLGNRGIMTQQKINIKYYQGWSEIIDIANEYEFYLVGCLDRHGMLLANKDMRLAASRPG